MTRRKRPAPAPAAKAAPAPAALGPCMVPGCPHEIKVAKHRLCWGHYKRYLKDGTPGGPLRPLKHHPPAVI